MNAFTTLLATLGLVVLLASFIVLVLRSSFRRLLVELCRSENHGNFWFTFASIAIVLTTLFGALMVISTARLTAWDSSSALEFVATSFRAGLFALLLSLASVALALLTSIGLRGPSDPPILRT